MKKNMKKVFLFYAMLFLCLIAYLINISVFEKDIAINSYNPRLNKIDNSVERGMIFDSNGITLAETVTTDDKIKREYMFPREFCHIIGYMQKGKAGVEAKYNFTLQEPTNELYQRIMTVFSDKEKPRGNNLFLTIDSDLQQYVYKKLGKKKGAVVVLEPSTGKILSMVSYPNFNPEKIEENWTELKQDKDNSPLLNRATQGLYPPGSTFKIITAGAEIETNPNYANTEFNCEGKAFFDRKKIHCFNSTVHKKETLSDAVKNSCNTFFATIGQKMGHSTLKTYTDKAMFNNSLKFSLDYNKSSFSLNENSIVTEVVETAIGQGKTLVTPLHIAMITSAVANNGVMMKPYVVDHVESYSRNTLTTYEPEQLSEIFKEDTAKALTEMMQEVVNSGTGIDAKIKGISVAGKTGTAENSTGKDHSWFTAFAPAEDPKIAVAVILEQAGTGSEAIPITRDIIKYYLS